MKMHPHIYYTQIDTHDGVRTPFPVSKHVLKVPVNETQKVTRRSSFLNQRVSLFLTAILFASTFGLTYGKIDNTFSYFRDNEVSPDNAFAAGLLGFRVNPGDVTIPIKEGGVINLSPLFEPKPNSFEIMYRVRAKIVGDDSPICMLLQATGTSSPYIYSGSLKDMITEPATTTGHGFFEVTLPNAVGIPNGASCTIALQFNGWYVGAEENTGYTDTHQDTFTFVYEAPEQVVAPESSALPESPTEGTPPSEEQPPSDEAPPEMLPPEESAPALQQTQEIVTPPAENTSPTDSEQAVPETPAPESSSAETPQEPADSQ